VNSSVLVAGFATRHVARSARCAGYTVYAVDHFCDQDLYWYVEDAIRFQELEELPDAMQEMCGRHRIDMLVVTSGAEALPSAIPVCGTKADHVQPFLDKLSMQHFFEDLGIPVPALAFPGQYPVMVKPRTGAGGWRNAIIASDAEMEAWLEFAPASPFITQQVVDGIPASVCCITDGKGARAVGVNEQILRGTNDARFGFCGSITPFEHPARDMMIAYAEQAAAASGCIGTIGVDFVVGDQLYAIEVNPRFQATVDTVEMATGCNIFSLHVDACRGILPSGSIPVRRFSARTILFAERDREIPVDLSPLSPVVADIPWPGTYLDEGMAVVSVFGWGHDRSGALMMLEKNIRTVRQYMG
jgi:predicted ATP-grasp superfamily ATP-dependent carboligase